MSCDWLMPPLLTPDVSLCSCAGGVAPVCRDGSAPDPSSLPPCAGGPPRCEDGGSISCADGTPLGPLAAIIG